MKLWSLLSLMFISLCISCTDPEDASPRILKEVQVSSQPSKVEVTLYKGGVVTFTSERSIKGNFENKHVLEPITVYRKINNSNCDCKTNTWNIDNASPQRFIDTTLLFYDNHDKLVKIEYRQGFISKIFE